MAEQGVRERSAGGLSSVFALLFSICAVVLGISDFGNDRGPVQALTGT